MNSNNYHIVQFVCLMTLFVAIMLQGFTGVVKLKPLSPYMDKIVVVKQDLSLKTYLKGSYQDYLAHYARKKTGFKEFFSRCYNH